MDDGKYVFTKGDHSIFWHKAGFDVVRQKNWIGNVDSTYELSANGLDMAISRCYYLAGAFQGIRGRGGRVALIKEIRAVAEDLFSMGQRSAHKRWIEE